MNEFISGNEAKELIDTHNALVVDVRSSTEFFVGSVPGALNIPLQDLANRVHELESENHIIVFCRSGARSTQAKTFLHSLGFSKVSNGGSFNNMLSCFD